MTTLKSDGKSNRSCVLLARTAVASSESANPLEAQLSSLRAYAGQHELAVVREVELSGISGAETAEAAERLIERKLDRNDFDLVLVTSVDRLARNSNDGMRILHRFDDAGIEVIEVCTGGSPMGAMQYCRELSRRVTR